MDLHREFEGPATLLEGRSPSISECEDKCNARSVLPHPEVGRAYSRAAGSRSGTESHITRIQEKGLFFDRLPFG